ncbi:MAG TPA: TolC family protein [Bacteroidales bacterium]|nr:TolC family protein [Bacteroidales bacterium]
MRKPLVSLLFGCLLVLPLSAQEKLTFEESISIGFKNNYDVIISRNNQEVASNNVSLGNAGFLPVVDVNASQSNSVNNTRQEFISGSTSNRDNARSSSFNTGVKLDWTVFDGLNMFVSYNQLQELENMGELTTRMALENLYSDITVAYYNIVQQKQQLAAIKDAVELSKERVRLAKEKYRLGSQSKMEVLQATVDLNADSSSLLKQQEALKNAQIELNRILARNIMTDYQVADSIQLHVPLMYDTLVQAMNEQNTELQMASRNKALSEMDLKLIKGRRLPQIGVNMGYNYSKSQSQAGFLLSSQVNGLTYGVTASVNIFDGFNRNREEQNAKIAIENQQLVYQRLQDQLGADLGRSYITYSNDLRLVVMERENLEVARQNVDIALERYRLGALSGLELREVQRNLLDAESRLIAARYQAKLAETALLQTSGLLLKQE